MVGSNDESVELLGEQLVLLVPDDDGLLRVEEPLFVVVLRPVRVRPVFSELLEDTFEVSVDGFLTSFESVQTSVRSSRNLCARGRRRWTVEGTKEGRFEFRVAL